MISCTLSKKELKVSCLVEERGRKQKQKSLKSIKICSNMKRHVKRMGTSMYLKSDFFKFCFPPIANGYRGLANRVFLRFPKVEQEHPALLYFLKDLNLKFENCHLLNYCQSSVPTTMIGVPDFVTS